VLLVAGRVRLLLVEDERFDHRLRRIPDSRESRAAG
jgi:hypothetical protein